MTHSVCDSSLPLGSFTLRVVLSRELLGALKP
jgi:hypothetical protein